MRDLVGGLLLYVVMIVPVSVCYALFTSGQEFQQLPMGTHAMWHTLFACLASALLVLALMLWQRLDKNASRR